MRRSHTIPPVWDKDSRVLILGSFPSVRSREAGFYYHHPQNRFWRVLAALFDEEVPQDIPARRAFLIRHRIALWDVIADCELDGSADADIRDPHPNDIAALLSRTRIRRVFCNGALAMKLYRRFAGQALPGACPLPSTSPANASYSLSRLLQAWESVREAALADGAPAPEQSAVSDSGRCK